MVFTKTLQSRRWMRICLVAMWTAVIVLIRMAQSESAGYRQGNASQFLPEFGFIISRYVASPDHDELWRECYKCIRAAFPDAPVIIIDDHSNVTLVDQDFDMVSSSVIASEFSPGKGEILPYYFFHKLKPFRKAVLLSDGMFILQKEPLLKAVRSTRDWRFLWHFMRDRDISLEAQQSLIDVLRPDTRPQLHALRSDHTKWAGCFAASVIITWDFLNRLEENYEFFNMLDAINCRMDRMGLERLVALMSIDATALPPIENVSVYGSIHDQRRAFDYKWNDYVVDKASEALANERIVKVWNGRR